ncbi:UDP-2,3-diacylglucosamine diphosphatase [Polluticaenibacter yanchengensis]|uniref:UDP-2,3-diacylglucosamine diphosphatase n=1 Tax=Polluticaenibacter yanchengensis TaxID=3014562 RepID=A0ABT4UMS1_9BACT|nr:UDP-2,3-diacylglucosamine diphosphatase [Chitinophagaceae bacterium LY-5]
MPRRNVNVVVISDVHLGTYGCHAQELLQYLKSIKPSLLIINGDFVDIWNFSKRYFPPSHLAIIQEVLNMISQGTRVIYVTGNHDEKLRQYSETTIGGLQIVDKLLMEIDGKMCWIFHGDVFDATTQGSAKFFAKLGGKGYDLLILLNRSINWCLKVFGKEKMSFSKKVKDGVKQAVAFINNFETTAADLAIDKKYDYVICGHIHQPQKKEYKNEKGSVMYLNSGDWVENLTALEYSNKEWSIYTYDATAFEKVQIKKASQALNVLSEEINIYLNTII